MDMPTHQVLPDDSLMSRYHCLRQAGESEQAADLLRIALQTEPHRAEALIWMGLDALQDAAPQRAFLYLAQARERLAERSDIVALLALCAQSQDAPQQAHALLTAAWRRKYGDSTLRQALWQARQQSFAPHALQRQILLQLPEIRDPAELGQVVQLFADSQNEHERQPLGVIRYDSESASLEGWVLDPQSGDSPPVITLRAHAQAQSFSADDAHPLLAAAGVETRWGGIEIRLPHGQPFSLHVECRGQALQGSPLLVAPRQAEQPAGIATQAAPGATVDILVPVYEGLEETLACVDSVLNSRRLNRTPHRLIVLDDASPNRKLSQRLQALAKKGRLTYIRQPHNLGFIGNMNHGMRLHSQGDVVWLNADTRVHGDWLDRLRDAAYRSEDIASVTPLTNNGELMSFPASCVSHPMPSAAQHAELDDLARQLAQPAVEIEAGCGFCLYIKRQALDVVGYLDEVHLQRGYGEETDWCLRARALGWKHMGALDVFVAHQGGISFGEEKVLRVASNNALLRRRYPQAEQRYTSFYLRDPLRPARDALQRARLPVLARRMKPAPLHIAPHGRSEAPLRLEYRNHGQISQASLRLVVDGLPLTLDYRLPDDHHRLRGDLAVLKLAELRLDYRGNCPNALLELLEQAALPYDVDLHDESLLERPALLQRARQVRLPWQALLADYRERHPQIRWQASAAKPLPGRPAQDEAPVALLIADRPTRPHLVARLRQLARRLRRQHPAVQLLLPADTPLDADLLKLGNLHRLPDIDGLTAQEVLTLCGCNAALSLDDTPTLDWPAPELAAQYGLPLYAPDSAIAHEAAALPLAELLATTGLTNVLEA